MMLNNEVELNYWELMDLAYEKMLQETLGDSYASYIAAYQSEDYLAFCEAEA